VPAVAKAVLDFIAETLVPSLALHSVPVANPIDEVCHSILYICACLFALLCSSLQL